MTPVHIIIVIIKQNLVALNLLFPNPLLSSFKVKELVINFMFVCLFRLGLKLKGKSPKLKRKSWKKKNSNIFQKPSSCNKFWFESLIKKPGNFKNIFKPFLIYRHSSFNVVLLYRGILSNAVFSRSKTALNFHLTRFFQKKKNLKKKFFLSRIFRFLLIFIMI